MAARPPARPPRGPPKRARIRSRPLRDATGHSACAPLRRGLRLVAIDADRLQVRVVIRAAACLGCDVVNVRAARDAPRAQAWLAQARVALQDLLAEFVPGRAVSTLMAIAALPI